LDRLACLELPAFALQLLGVLNPDWKGKAAAVVERDSPQAQVTHANELARAAGVLPGTRYAAALGLCADLCAGVIDSVRVRAASADLLARLQRFSPLVEPKEDEDGVFWLHGHGLGRLYPRPSLWGDAILADLAAAGFEGRLALGFAKFTTYAAAKARVAPGLMSFADAAAERTHTESVPLARLNLPPVAREKLAKLGVTTVGAFARLPGGGVLERFGPQVHLLQRLAAGSQEEHFHAAEEAVPLAARVDLDQPQSTLEELIFHVRELAGPLLARLAARGEVAHALVVELDLDDGGVHRERVEPGDGTADLEWFLRLLGMRLEPARLCAGALGIEVVVEPAPARLCQDTLFVNARARDPRAQNKAFGALFAALGPDAVVRAVANPAHLPERSFTYERLVRLPAAAPRRGDSSNGDRPRGDRLPLVRRIYDPPIELPPRPRHEPDGWVVCGTDRGQVVRIVGPYRLCGGWWRAQVRREYHFAELASGDVVWIYYDVERRKWFHQATLA